MGKGIRLWGIWLTALVIGVYGTSLVYQGIFEGLWEKSIYGIPILSLGIWMTGKILSSARQAYRRQRVQ
ncbi:hypothetical protein LSG31_07055 [Fodinisporobacter ferrooxydans]|uniref:Uncharacterized protein n=1 Tax=Fodinisporobacter ferrooxydans TaxID=2901836 RepID=A0ABY4CRE3_9BACL|nr:hypothetical protein LSG31_07055 [Alicyclobacillaceae bacterium MYW30-H2]